jgi:hypothetical protein
MSKEDIWVSRIPKRPSSRDWNLYSPRWAPAKLVTNDGGESLILEDRDPCDYAKATRPLEADTKRIKFEMKIDEPLIIELSANGTIISTHTAARDQRQFEIATRGADAITFRTGERAAPASPDQDRPTKPAKFYISRISFE